MNALLIKGKQTVSTKVRTHLGRFVSQLIEERKISYRRLGEASGFGKSMISDIINGKSVPSRDKVPELAAGLTRLTGTPIHPVNLEYLIQIDIWGTMLLENKVGSDEIVRYQQLVDLIEARRQALGDVDFVQRCQANQVKPEELKAAQSGYIPGIAALGPISGLLAVSMDELVDFVVTDENCTQEC